MISGENAINCEMRASSIGIRQFGRDLKNQPFVPTSSHTYLQLVLLPICGRPTPSSGRSSSDSLVLADLWRANAPNG